MTSGPLNPENIDHSGMTEKEIRALYFKWFRTLFPTPEDSLEEIFRRIQAAGLISCHHCGGKDVVRDYGDREVVCVSCTMKSWFTAGTFFAHMRLACPWLAAIWFQEQGLCVNPFKFHKLLNIAYSSAVDIYKKLATVIKGDMGDDAFALSSALFSDVIGKRSRETPARAHPLAEQDEVDKQMLSKDSDSDETSATSTLTQPEKALYKLLSVEPAHFDVLCQWTGMPAGDLSALLMNLELGGFTQRLSGNKYIRKTLNRAEQSAAYGARSSTSTAIDDDEIIDTIVEFIQLNFHRISRKYLQIYLAVYWCCADRERWKVGSLFEACLRFGPVRYSDILAYVSPAVVKVLPRQ